MKNEERRKQTKDRLLRVTKQLLQTKGCHSLTLKEIMESSGLSKGAIFHYVKSKDDIFIWILLEHLETLDEAVMSNISEAKSDNPEGPMPLITENLSKLDHRSEVTNKALLYLLGKEDEPHVSEALQQFYDKSVEYSTRWIELGKRLGAIHDSIDADKTGELFALLSMGLRVRTSMHTNGRHRLSVDDITAFMSATLKL